MSSVDDPGLARAPAPGRRLDGPTLVGLALLGLLVVAWIVAMQREWRTDPDLSHGLVSPLLFALALREACTRGTPRYLREGRGTAVGLGALLGGALLVLLWAGLLAAALTWSNALVGFLLAASLSALSLAGLVVAAGQSRRLVPFNYPAVVAPLLWLLSAPLPPGTYGRLTLALQRLITDGVVGTLHLLGIPARQSGNLIQLATTVVGVEEACSGVRSLLSCLVAAVFFSATLVRRPAARIALILMAAPLALGMNFLRSLGLTLAADHGWSISGWVHDASGFAVLGLTAAALAALALALERERTAPRPAPTAALPSRRPGPAYALVGATAAAAVITGAFAWATQPGLPRPGTVPDLYALLPASPPGWVVETPEDLYRFRATLQTDALAQRTYVRPRGDDVLQITVYLAYWRPGQAAVSLVAAHTPDACWPGAGWSAASDDPRAAAPRSGGGLPRAEYRLFTRGDLAQHVWFWHLHGGEVISDAAPLSPFRLIPRVLEHGIRSDAAQVFLRISSNHPWNIIADEKLMLEIMNGLAPILPVSPAPP